MEAGGRGTGPPGVNSRSASAQHSAADLEVLRNIEHVYFSCPRSLDAGRYVLERVPPQADCAAIERLFTDLKRQQQVVSGKALHLISQQRDNCDREFREMQALREALAVTLDACRAARAHVRAASNKLTINTLTILANFRKRQIARSALKSLELLRVLRDVERDVGDKLVKKDYEGAISLILKCRKAAAAHEEYTCIEALSARLQDTLEMTEEKLDVVLASLCRSFDEGTFARLRRAYGMLGKNQAAMEQLHMHYTSAVNESAVDAVRPFVEDGSADKLQDLCQLVSSDSAPACLLNLCENLLLVMRSYYLLVDWHDKHDGEEDSESNALESEKNISKEYIRQKLKTGLMRIWHDVQAKVSVFLKCAGLENYPFEKFIQMLGILRRLTQVAEVFCGDKADVIQDFIKTHSIAYIKNYHRGRMEELKLFLENEGWEQCPVKTNFTLLNLQEFKSLKKYINPTFKSDISVVSSQTGTSTHSQDDSVYIIRYFTSKTKHTPFEIFRNESVTNDDIFGLEPEQDGLESSEESEDEPDELKKDFVDENVATDDYNSTNNLKNSVHISPIRTGTNNIIVTNTTLSVLRHCGQYLQMCRYLQPIALEVIVLMFQLYDYYVYSVHLFFTADLEVASNTLYTSKLNATLKRIANNVDSTEDETKIGRPEMLQNFQLSEESLHGLTERVVAVESVIFLTRQFEMLHPYLESIVAPHQKMILEHFRDNTLAASSDLRNPIYMCSGSKAVDARNILIAMSQVKWDARNVATDHNAYVDIMVRQLQVFALRLDNVAAKVTLNVEIANAVWTMVSKFVVHLLVEGFSNATKCSNGGRGLMQLDYTQLFMKLEKTSGLKPIPYQDYVDRYVKAYYLPRASLEDFCRERTEYSKKHLLALIACACENKRDRQELTTVVENRDV